MRKSEKSPSKPLRSKPSVASGVVYRANRDGTIILTHLDDFKFFYNISGISALLVRKMNGKVTVGDLIDFVVDRYDVSREHCEKDVLTFLKKLKDYKILA